jgi:hypothetical protein
LWLLTGWRALNCWWVLLLQEVAEKVGPLAAFAFSDDGKGGFQSRSAVLVISHGRIDQSDILCQLAALPAADPVADSRDGILRAEFSDQVLNADGCHTAAPGANAVKFEGVGDIAEVAHRVFSASLKNTVYIYSICGNAG